MEPDAEVSVEGARIEKKSVVVEGPVGPIFRPGRGHCGAWQGSFNHL